MDTHATSAEKKQSLLSYTARQQFSHSQITRMRARPARSLYIDLIVCLVNRNQSMTRVGYTRVFTLHIRVYYHSWARLYSYNGKCLVYTPFSPGKLWESQVNFLFLACLSESSRGSCNFLTILCCQSKGRNYHIAYSSTSQFVAANT